MIIAALSTRAGAFRVLAAAWPALLVLALLTGEGWPGLVIRAGFLAAGAGFGWAAPQCAGHAAVLPCGREARR